MQPVGGPIHLTEEAARDWFTRMVDPGRPTDFYCLIFNEESAPIGEISFHRLDQANMTANFNVKIASARRGQGYAGEAMSVFLDYFFNQLGGRVMLDDVALDNQAGQQALLRFGFEHDPGVPDVFRLRLTRERFNALAER